jgi:hypothetical protein
MDQATFSRQFHEAVRRALEQAEMSAMLGEPIVEFHGKGGPKRRISLAETVDLLWLSEDRFYRIVDVGAYVVEDNPPVMFVVATGFEPGSYQDTWDPSGLGPFKVIGPVYRNQFS